jgi:hypothetical protein
MRSGRSNWHSAATPFDVLVTDLRMEPVDGAGVVRVVRGNCLTSAAEGRESGVWKADRCSTPDEHSSLPAAGGLA